MAEVVQDVNAAFDSILLGEEGVVGRGWEEGRRAGATEGLAEGARLGRQKGGEVGQEVGFYQGFAEGWTEVYRGVGEERRAAKVRAALEKLVEAAAAVPGENTGEGCQESLDKVGQAITWSLSLAIVSSPGHLTK